MTFEAYWSILIKRWYIIPLCLVLVGGGALLVSLIIPPTYRSTALIQVEIHSGDNQSDINELLASNQLVQTESQLATSDPILQEVASHHPEMTMRQLENMASSEPKLNTQLFALHVQAGNAKEAAKLTNELATTFIAHQDKVQRQADQDEKQQLQQEINVSQKQIDGIKKQLSTAYGSTLDDLDRQLAILQQHNNQWQSALTQLELVEVQSNNFLLLVQAARPETTPVQPMVLLNTGAGCGVGCLLGLFLVVVIEKGDQRVCSASVIRQIVDWPVLSVVWSVPEPDDIHHFGMQSINVDAYQLLRSYIGFAGAARPLRYLLVTSTLPYEGKSTIAANLAVCMAMAGKNTLLIDGDLRRPVLHDKFCLAADKLGLSNAVLACRLPEFQSSLPGKYPPKVDTKMLSLEPYMHKVGIPHLRVMPSGPLPPDPSGLLSSRAMQRLFHVLEKSEAEIVIFDASSLLEISDAMILSSKVDGTVIVIDPKRVYKQQLYQIQSDLAQAGAHVVGYVVNKQRRYRRQIPASYYHDYHSAKPIRQAVLEKIPDA